MKKHYLLKLIIAITVIAGNINLNAQTPVLHYTFDDVTSNTGSDGTAGDLTLIAGSAAYESGRINNAYKGNGVDNALGTTWGGITGKAARTITAWVKFPVLDEKRGVITLGSRPDANDKGARFTVLVTAASGSNQVVLSIQGKTIKHETIFSDADLNKWIFIAVTHDGSDFISGSAVSVDKGAGIVTNTGADNTVALNTTNYTSGPKTILFSGWAAKTNDTGSVIEQANITIDDLRVYDVALTPTQIIAVRDEAPALGVKEVAFGANELKVFPSIVTKTLNLESNVEEKLKIRVYSLTGKLVKRAYGKEVDMSSLSSGLYLVKVRAGNKVSNFKIIKE
jgi:hypothetical protein